MTDQQQLTEADLKRLTDAFTSVIKHMGGLELNIIEVAIVAAHVSGATIFEACDRESTPDSERRAVIDQAVRTLQNAAYASQSTVN